MPSQTFPPQAQPFLFEGGKHGVLLIHGFTATPALVRPLGEALRAASAAAGDPLTIQGILLPGHGTCLEDMRSHGGHRPWLNAAREAFDALAQRCECVSVIGHSMGGVLALLLAQEKPVHAVVSIAAPIRLTERTSYLAPLLGWAKPFIPHKEKHRAPGYDEAYDISYAGMPVCRVGDLLRLMRKAERNLAQVRCPLLVIQSRDDETVRQASAEIIHQRAGSARKELLWLEHSGHVCTIGPERAQLFEACIAFLRGVEPLGACPGEPTALQSAL